MQNRKPHRQKAPQTGHSIFGTILFSLLAVLAVEILLLTFTVPRHPAWPPAEPERRGYPCHAGGQPQPVSSVHPP